MSRPRAGYIGFNRVPEASGAHSPATGIWTLREAEALKRAGTWPNSDGDPYFSNVSLLLHMDGTNGSTAFTDSSGTPKTVTASGATISTAQSKFGGASGSFGASAYATIPINSAFEFGTGDFTVEAFVRATSFNNNTWGRIIGIGNGANGGGPYTGWSFSVAQNNIRFYRFDGTTEFLYDAAVSLSTNTWYHVAVSRSGTTLAAYLDGSRIATFSSSVPFNKVNENDVWIGRVQGGMGDTYFNGFIDELRVTKGTARYTGSTISVPSVPFPNAGTASTPGAPTSLSATAGNAQAALSWTAPADNGGSAITDYVVQFSSNGGSLWNTFADGTSTATSATVTGLTNGTAYVFRVAAVNAVGTGAYTAASSSVTPSAADPFTTKIINVNGPNNATTSYGSWSGSGTASSKLTPSGTFASAKLITGISGTLRITGTVNDGYDGYGHSIRKNGGAGLIATNGVLSINVSVSVSPGDEITFSSSAGGGASFWPTADDFMFGNSDRTNSTSDIRVWIE